jgi:hypothetical protein
VKLNVAYKIHPDSSLFRKRRVCRQIHAYISLSCSMERSSLLVAADLHTPPATSSTQKCWKKCCLSRGRAHARTARSHSLLHHLLRREELSYATGRNPALPVSTGPATAHAVACCGLSGPRWADLSLAQRRECAANGLQREGSCPSAQ